MILLIDNYDSFTYNIYQYVESLGEKCHVVRNDAITVEEIKSMKPKKIILSPGPGNPNDAGITLEVIKSLGETFSILGVCLGHQAIGQAFGASIVKAPEPMHGKLSEINHDGLGIFKKISKSVKVARYHSLIIDKKTLPLELKLTASTSDGIIMGVRHKKLKIEGIQFHPESIATEQGLKMISNFLESV